jgi:hypothetical protein
MTDPAERSIAPLWILAIIASGIATWVCYDAIPGINWLLWVAVVAAGVTYFARNGPGESIRPVHVLAGIPVVLAAGAAITANPVMMALIFMVTAVLLAMAMLASSRTSLAAITAGFTVAAPILAVANVFITALKRAGEATALVRSDRARAVVRGLAITIPILLVFALLLAVADPTFALWRNTIRDLIADWEFLPRSIFFIVVLGLMVGAYGYILWQRDASREDAVATSPREWLGSGERLMLIGGIAALLWLFLLVQLT